MSSAVMVGLLWVAAGYRIVLSIRSSRTIWRTAFTVCVLGVALGATVIAYGDRWIDRWPGSSNLSVLLAHLSLITASTCTSIYVSTLRRVDVRFRPVAVRLLAGLAICIVEIVAWLAAPIHIHELASLDPEWNGVSASVFNVVFALVIVLGASETAVFCFTRASSRDDLVRTISLLLTGSACTAGAVVFILGGIAVVHRSAAGSDLPSLTSIFDRSIPYIMVVLALGTLSLWLGPSIVDFIVHYRRWRVLRPLWRDLVRAVPEVHLDVPAHGGPCRRMHVRVQRTAVEIQDALRLMQAQPERGQSGEQVLRSPSSSEGSRESAVAVLDNAATEADLDQLLILARNYSRRAA